MTLLELGRLGEPDTGSLNASFGWRGRFFSVVPAQNISVRRFRWLEGDPITGASAYRIGIADGFGPADGITWATIPWVRYVDVPAATVAAARAVPQPVDADLSSPASLTAGVTYTVVLARVTNTDSTGPWPAGESSTFDGALIDWISPLGYLDTTTLSGGDAGGYCVTGSDNFTSTHATRSSAYAFSVELWGGAGRGWVVGAVAF